MPDARIVRIDRSRRSSVSRPTTSARTSSRWCGRSGSGSTSARDGVLVIDDNSPDGTGAIADGLAARAAVVAGAPPPRQGGPRPRVHRGLPARARRRGRARPRGRLRLLPRPRRRAPADRRLRGRGRSRDRLALGRRRRHGQLGPRPDPHLARRQLLRADDPRRRHPRPDGGIQVLPPWRARDDRARPGHREGLRVPDRDDLSHAPRRIPRSSRSRSRSPTGAWASRRCRARSSSRRCSRCPRSAGAPSAARCSPHLHWRDGRGHRRDLRRTRCSRAASP